MESIGNTLREARAHQGTDLGDVEAKTKIRSRYLRALENEDFHLLPGHAYARSFLRTYADLLGLDSQELVQEYRYQVEGEPRPGAPPPQVAEHDPQRVAEQEPAQVAGHEPPQEAAPDYPPLYYDGPPRREVPPLPDAEPVDDGSRATRTLRSDVAAAAGSVAMLRRRLGPRAALVAGAVILVVALAVAVVALVSSGTNSGQQAAKVSPPPPPAAPAPGPPSQPLQMTIAPAGRTYICVDTGANTNTLFQGIIFTPQSFTAPDLRITLGKRDGNLQVNGRPIPLGNDNTPIGIEFTQTGQRQLTPEERPCPAPTSSATATPTNVSSTGSGPPAPATPTPSGRHTP